MTLFILYLINIRQVKPTHEIVMYDLNLLLQK